MLHWSRTVIPTSPANKKRKRFVDKTERLTFISEYSVENKTRTYPRIFRKSVAAYFVRVFRFHGRQFFVTDDIEAFVCQWLIWSEIGHYWHKPGFIICLEKDSYRISFASKQGGNYAPFKDNETSILWILPIISWREISCLRAAM